MADTTALILGISGQDGSYLAELLHAKSYEVHGVVRSLTGPGADALRAQLPFASLHEAELQDLASLVAVVGLVQPDEIYNLAGLSSVSRSWAQPELTAEITGLGALRVLEAIRLAGRLETTRFYQASSSEMFGNALVAPQNESTPFAPVHPYAVAKVFAHQTTVSFRNAYGTYACCGILFNHESPRRGEDFVTRKITQGVARIALGRQAGLTLGNLDVRRDWGYAPEYAEAMWMILQQAEPDDFVIATGTTHSVRDFVGASFRQAGIEDWEPLVTIDPALLRPADIAELRGDASKAQAKLGWTASTPFEDVVRIMVEADLARESAAAP
jgi:GDPmannose 4,6-dehydratase